MKVSKKDMRDWVEIMCRRWCGIGLGHCVASVNKDCNSRKKEILKAIRAYKPRKKEPKHETE
jgi:hypothetical protein